MAKKLKPQPGIMDIALYVGGASTLSGKEQVLKLSSNESPYGPSERAKLAFTRTAANLHRYPGTDHAALRDAIAEVHALDPQRIICGVGSDEVLQFAVQCFAGPGDEAIYTQHGFSMYPILAKAAGVKPVCVAEKNRKVDVEAILSAVTSKTRIVFVTNPGNPTSTRISDKQLTRLADGLPENVLLILDGAYAEFADGFDGGAKLATERENVLMTRTFSKAYGLGGLRIGWGYAAQSVIDVLNRVRQPFNLSQTQLETAEAAVRDVEFTAKVVADNARMREWLVSSLNDIGVKTDNSETNFVLARFGSENEANACDEALRDDGILVRKVAGYGLPNCLRITVGDEASCRRVVHVIGQFKGVR